MSAPVDITSHEESPAGAMQAPNERRETDQDDGPLPTLKEVLSTQFSCWYPTFSKLPPNELGRANVTIKSKVLDLPDSFRDYLAADGVHLPQGTRVSSGMKQEDNSDNEWSSSSSIENEEATTATNDAGIENAPTLSFPKLEEEIQQAIQQLGGHVVPKLNWSCPKDAVWMNGGSLKCETAGDVFLLLQASDFCSYDVHHALEDIMVDDENDKGRHTHHSPLQLVLRKWCNLYPSQEFRCFVRQGQLLAICQRQTSQHYPHLAPDADLYQSYISEFFDVVLQEHFELTNYVFDVYIDKKNRVWLVDLNVWGRRTDALLFSWSELMSMSLTDGGEPVMRVVETERRVRPDPLSNYRAPIDTLHVASVVGGDAQKFEEFMKMCDPPSVLDAEEVERQRKELDQVS